MTQERSTAEINRRELLGAGSGIGALALAGLLGNETVAAPPRSSRIHSPLARRDAHFQPKVKRIIQFFMNGGPSQFDTFYPKPEIDRLDGQELPASFKQQLQPTQRKRAGLLFGSPFKFKRHGDSGLPVSELFPHVAKHVDELCFLHSMQGEIANHSPGLLLTNCGHSTLSRPSVGSWLLYGLGNESDELPGYVVLCPKGLPTAQSRNWTSAFLPGVFQGTHIDI
jgi:hypothetical protein